MNGGSGTLASVAEAGLLPSKPGLAVSRVPPRSGPASASPAPATGFAVPHTTEPSSACAATQFPPPDSPRHSQGGVPSPVYRPGRTKHPGKHADRPSCPHLRPPVDNATRRGAVRRFPRRRSDAADGLSPGRRSPTDRLRRPERPHETARRATCARRAVRCGDQLRTSQLGRAVRS